MALISAGEWIDRYAADAERRSARDDADEPRLTFHVETAAGDVPHRVAEPRGRHWPRLSHMPRLYGTFHPIGSRPLRRFARRRR